MRVGVFGGIFVLLHVWTTTAELAMGQAVPPGGPTAAEGRRSPETAAAPGATPSSDAPAGPERLQDTAEPQNMETWPISSGIVILQGQYVPRPYVLRQEGDVILLNGRPLDLEKLEGGFMGRGGWRPPRDDWVGPRSSPRWRSPLARLERHLKENSMLLGFRDGSLGFVTPGREMKILDVLLSDASAAMKVHKLVDVDVYWISSAHWQELVETFQPDPALADLLAKLKAAVPKNVELPSVKSAHDGSKAYAMTVIALVLGVYGMGMLMNHLPKHGVAWRERDATGEHLPMVLRCVILVVLQGSFDLGCTLLARQSPSFWELNPLGSVLMEDPTALTGFKFASLLMGASILLWLRRYRGAQTASWWLCLLSTIVTFRWVTFGSMFLT